MSVGVVVVLVGSGGMGRWMVDVVARLIFVGQTAPFNIPVTASICCLLSSVLAGLE